MERLARVCAIVTGSLALLAGFVDLSWWVSARLGAYTSGAVSLVAWLPGFLGFLVMFGMLLGRTGERRWTVGRRIEILSLIWRKAPRLLLVGLTVVLVSAILGAAQADAESGGWGIDTPYGWHNCPWPLSMNHDTQHECVSHERYLAVQKETDRIFVAFGIGFLTVDCVAFTILSRTPRGPGRRRTPTRVHGDVVAREPFPRSK